MGTMEYAWTRSMVMCVIVLLDTLEKTVKQVIPHTDGQTDTFFLTCILFIDVDNCLSSPCQNGGECHDIEAEFFCNCPDGFTGDRCETGIDACASNPCQSGGSCQEHVNGFTCECLLGYTGETCETSE